MQHKLEVRFEMLDVERIGIGEGDEAATFGQLCEERIREKEIGFGNDDAIPSVPELVEGDLDVEAGDKVFVPGLRREVAFLPLGPEGVALDGGPHFFR